MSHTDLLSPPPGGGGGPARGRGSRGGGLVYRGRGRGGVGAAAGSDGGRAPPPSVVVISRAQSPARTADGAPPPSMGSHATDASSASPPTDRASTRRRPAPRRSDAIAPPAAAPPAAAPPRGGGSVRAPSTAPHSPQRQQTPPVPPPRKRRESRPIYVQTSPLSLSATPPPPQQQPPAPESQRTTSKTALSHELDALLSPRRGGTTAGDSTSLYPSSSEYDTDTTQAVPARPVPPPRQPSSASTASSASSSPSPPTGPAGPRIGVTPPRFRPLIKSNTTDALPIHAPTYGGAAPLPPQHSVSSPAFGAPPSPRAHPVTPNHTTTSQEQHAISRSPSEPLNGSSSSSAPSPGRLGAPGTAPNRAFGLPPPSMPRLGAVGELRPRIQSKARTSTLTLPAPSPPVTGDRPTVLKSAESQPTVTRSSSPSPLSIERHGMLLVCLAGISEWRPMYVSLTKGNLSFATSKDGDIEDGLRLDFCSVSSTLDTPNPYERPSISVTPNGKKEEAIRMSADDLPSLRLWLADITRVINTSRKGTLMESSERRTSMSQRSGFAKDIRKALCRSKVAAQFFAKPSIAACSVCGKRGPALKQGSGFACLSCTDDFEPAVITTATPASASHDSQRVRPRSRSFGVPTTKAPEPPMLGRAKGNWNRAKKILGGSATTQETQIELLRDDQQSQLLLHQKEIDERRQRILAMPLTVAAANNANLDDEDEEDEHQYGGGGGTTRPTAAKTLSNGTAGAASPTLSKGSSLPVIQRSPNRAGNAPPQQPPPPVIVISDQPQIVVEPPGSPSRTTKQPPPALLQPRPVKPSNSRFSTMFGDDDDDDDKSGGRGADDPSRKSTIFTAPPKLDRLMGAGAGYAMMFAKSDDAASSSANGRGSSISPVDEDDDDLFQLTDDEEEQDDGHSHERNNATNANQSNKADEGRERSNTRPRSKTNYFRISRSSLLIHATDWKKGANAPPSSTSNPTQPTQQQQQQQQPHVSSSSSSSSSSVSTSSSKAALAQFMSKDTPNNGAGMNDDDDDEEDLYIDADDDDDEDFGEDEDDSDWNQRFQAIMEKISTFSPNTPINEEITTNLALIGLAQDFLYSATAYGKIIISEVYLPDSKKTIKPANVGGVAGGSKYIAQDILFKFALDTEGLYGYNDSAAATVAGHELKGLQAYFNCAIRDLSLPLMALVDYRGFRLIAISFLPLNHSTLVYGTNDGGHTIHDKSPRMRHMMKRASEILNLRPHMAGLVPEKRKIMYSAADLEGHRGTDGRFYLLDFSRTFPCEAPISRLPGINLTRLFRPEFVRSYKSPLCPDAYSSFTDTSYNADIDAATRHLHWDLVPRFARLLPTLLVEQQSGLLDGSGGNTLAFRLTEAVHSHGINVRYLGLVFSSLSSLPNIKYRDACRALVFIEMLARVIKNDLRQRLRDRMKKVKKPLEEPYRRLVIDFLNVVIGSSPESINYWDNELLDGIQAKFDGLVLKIDAMGFKAWSADLIVAHSGSSYVDWRWIVLSRVQRMIGLVFTARAQKELSANFNRKLDRAQPISRTDLDQIGERIKHMNIVSYAEGYLLLVKAIQNRSFDSATAISCLSMSIEKFEDVLNSNTNNKMTLRTCANALLLLDEELAIKSQYRPRVEDNLRVQRAIKYMRRAIDIDPNDPLSLLPYASFMQKIGNNMEAEQYFLRALESDPNFTNALNAYAEFLQMRGQHLVAAQFYRRIEQLTELGATQ